MKYGFIDAGNGWIKYFNPKLRRTQFGSFRHALKPLTEAEWRNISVRGDLPTEHIRVNDQPYILGDAARKHIIPERPQGADRYDRNYYGAMAVYALSQSLMLKPGEDNKVVLFASYAPRDVDYVEHLRASLIGRWKYDFNDEPVHFEIVDVMCFDEPLGGFYNHVLNENGTEDKRKRIGDKTIMVIDSGSFTIDGAAVDPGGNIDYSSLDSTLSGTLDMLTRFEKELRSNNREIFKGVRTLDIRRVEKALMTGKYTAGKVAVDCRVEAEDARNELVNDIVQMINRMGGVLNFDYILLTGGGSALLHDKLQEALPRADFKLAESKDRLQYANVFGGARLKQMLKREGYLV